MFTQDNIVNKVLHKYIDRSNIGMLKYKQSMEDNKGDILYWLNHLQEELMDASLYIERLMQEIEKEK
jgi:hypothetical protein